MPMGKRAHAQAQRTAKYSKKIGFCQPNRPCHSSFISLKKSPFSLFFYNNPRNFPPLTFRLLLDLHGNLRMNGRDEILNDLGCQVPVRLFPSPQNELNAHLVSLLEELFRARQTHLLVSICDAKRQPDALDFHLLLRGALFLYLLLLLILKRPKVEDLGDGWVGLGRNLDQIQFALLGKTQGFLKRKHTEHLSFVVDHPEFRSVNFIVDFELGDLYLRFSLSVSVDAHKCLIRCTARV